MTKFLLVYRDEVEPKSQPSPEEMQGFLAMWGEWFQKFGGKIVDVGDALLPTGRVLKAGGEVSTAPMSRQKKCLADIQSSKRSTMKKRLPSQRNAPSAK
jgi:hypothetical protein